MTHPEDGSIDMDAYLTLDTTNGERRMDRYNSALFTFVSHLDVFNHIFVSTETDDEDSEAIMGTYIFSHNPAYVAIQRFMAANRFPMHLNESRVAPCDREAFDKSVAIIAAQESFEIPEDWK